MEWELTSSEIHHAMVDLTMTPPATPAYPIAPSTDATSVADSDSMMDMQSDIGADKAVTATKQANGPRKRKRNDSKSGTDEAIGIKSDPKPKKDTSKDPKTVSVSAPKGKASKAPASKSKLSQETKPSNGSQKAAPEAAGATTETPVRRTKGFKSRRGPSFQGAEVGKALLINEVPLEFSTTCYYVQLGTDGQIFFIHEYHLSKSPRLFEEVKQAKSKLRKTQQQIIQLLPHDVGAFGQLVGYLYSDTFKPLECNKPKKRIGHRMLEIRDVMSLAKYYNMPGLQKDVMRVVYKDRIAQKVDAGAFFDWAEEMWYEEMDVASGPFASYFRRYAPEMIQTVTEKDMKSMLKFVGSGGDFVKEVFTAMHKAMFMNVDLKVKMEDEAI